MSDKLDEKALGSAMSHVISTRLGERDEAGQWEASDEDFRAVVVSYLTALPAPADDAEKVERCAILREHDNHDAFKVVLMAPGQSEDFDTDGFAARAWLHPHLGSTHHLQWFADVEYSAALARAGERQ